MEGVLLRVLCEKSCVRSRSHSGVEVSGTGPYVRAISDDRTNICVGGSSPLKERLSPSITVIAVNHATSCA